MATYTDSYEFEFPRQSNAEEFANALTHAVGMILGGAGAVALITVALYRHASIELLLAVFAYGASLTAVYAASTFSHAFQEPRRKQFFRIVDQAVIYCLIAGTYTPFIFKYMPTERKWVLFAIVWALALTGFLSKMLLKHRIEAVAVVNYVALGWLPAAAMIGLLPLDCIAWMAVGGVLYTIGALFLTFDQRVPFFHATWHIFVLLASGFHFFSVAYFTIP